LLGYPESSRTYTRQAGFFSFVFFGHSRWWFFCLSNYARLMRSCLHPEYQLQAMDSKTLSPAKPSAILSPSTMNPLRHQYPSSSLSTYRVKPHPQAIIITTTPIPSPSPLPPLSAPQNLKPSPLILPPTINPLNPIPPTYLSKPSNSASKSHTYILPASPRPSYPPIR